MGAGVAVVDSHVVLHLQVGTIPEALHAFFSTQHTKPVGLVAGNLLLLPLHGDSYVFA